MTLLMFKDVLKQENHRTVLKGISLTVQSSSKIGLKMTGEETEMFFQLMTGEVVPSSGEIECKTSSIQCDHSKDGLYEVLKVEAYLRFFKKIANFKEPLEAYIATFSLSDVWHDKVLNLTKEQKRRVSLFRMFLFSPEVVLIEDPLNNVTDEGIELYVKALAQLWDKGIATIVTSNYMEDLLLVSQQVFRYRQSTGLEATDLVQEPDVEDKVETEKSPVTNVFKVSCKMADKTIFFSPDEIDYIESINSVSHVRIDEDSFPTDLTMNELEEKLRTFGFFRCHRSYLVNLQRVSELISYSKNSYTLILKGNAQARLPLSRNRLEEMKQLLTF